MALDLGPEELNRKFEELAPQLGWCALGSSLQKAGLPNRALDALVVCTCTGYLCPGLSSYIAERAGLSPHCYLLDVVGQGCGAAIPALRAACGFLAAHPESFVACVAVELSSAAFFVDNDRGVLVSLCIFADGAAATIWSGSRVGMGWKAQGFDTWHLPGERQKLRFENRQGKLRNLLDRTVPHLAAEAVEALWQRSKEYWVGGESKVLAHPGGKEVVSALELRLPGLVVPECRHVLRRCGNMSSPSVLFVLEEVLKRPPGPRLWLVSFGAGFSVHSCWLVRSS
jgi:predicted naringenin-chalcone synthase